MNANLQYQQRIAQATRCAMDAGATILQIFQLGPDERAHVAELLSFFSPPANARVLDIGCGIGTVADMMKSIRPDLSFMLLNTNAWQLEHCSPDHKQCQADMHCTGLGSASFDAIMVNYAIGYARLKEAAAEFYRLLRDGGILFIWDIEGHSPTLLECLEYRSYPTDEFTETVCAAGFDLQSHASPNAQATKFRELLRLENDSVQAQVNSALDEIRPALWRFIK